MADPAENGEPVLALENVSKHFGPVRALQDVSLELHAGEVLALVGDNGAGKSTLIKTIAGTHRPDAGALYCDGEHVTIDNPQQATELGIATVYQDLALCDNLDVVSNLFLGNEVRRRGRLDETGMEHQANGVLKTLSTTIPNVRTDLATLSGGQRQQVAIARSLVGEPSIMLLDEPTAALGVSQTEQVLELIRRLRDRELGVIVISHNLADVFQIADRIFVLHLGRPAGDFVAADSSREDIVTAITGLARA